MDQTLKQAREGVQATLLEGGTCPCCDQQYRMYKRKLNTGMAHALILIYRAWQEAGGKDYWIDIKDIDVRGGDYGKLTHWGLLQRRSDMESGLGYSGHWRPTARGVAFVQGSTPVAAYALLYNNELTDLTGVPVYITDVLGDKLNYKELMS